MTNESRNPTPTRKIDHGQGVPDDHADGRLLREGDAEVAGGDVAEVVRVRLPDRLVGGAQRGLQLLEDLGIRADLLAVVGDEPVER